MIGSSHPQGADMFSTGQVVGGVSQRGSHGGCPAEYRPMTTDEHRLWNLKLRADMIGRAALKAMNSQQVQQRSVDYERQIQVLQAALEAQREAEAADNRRVEETPTLPPARVDGNHAANAQRSSPPGLPICVSGGLYPSNAPCISGDITPRSSSLLTR